LPITMERRSRESIPSQKRAEYRRRYEMLDQLEVDFERSWRGHHPLNRNALNIDTEVIPTSGTQGSIARRATPR